jgi:histidinol dehydrogenase
MKILRPGSRELEKIIQRNLCRKRRIEESVRKIISDVRIFGDEALTKYTRRFDQAKLSPKQFRVTETEISAAYQNITPKFVSTLKTIIENVTHFYSQKMRKGRKIKGEDGICLGEKIVPLEKVGVYIPAGSAPLVSSVYMCVLPAKIAQVEKIIMATPCNESGFVNPHILVIADLLKVNEIYKVGGAQAIAAMAFGTKTIPKVDKIVGPGNAYVTEAKRQVFGYVDIDMLAGPSEVVIIANQFSNPQFIAKDLEAQIEHANGLGILVTPSKKLARQMKKEVEKGYVVLVKNLEEAVEITNRIAPEHLEIMVKNPQKIVKKIKHAGAIFLGAYSPVAVGDYLAGPSHVLPTAATARFFSGLSTYDFVKNLHWIYYSKKALEKMREPMERMTQIEGLPKHYESVKARLE